MPLSDAACRGLKPKDRPYKTSDSGGLYILVQPNGSRLWRLAYRFEKKQKTLAFGAYPTVSLAEARSKRDAAKKALAAGKDPGVRTKEAGGNNLSPSSFETIAREWYEVKKSIWAPNYGGRVLSRLEQDVFPEIGARPIEQLTAPEVLGLLRQVEARGVYETAKRLRQTISQIFRYAVATGQAERDPAADLRGALRSPGRPKRHARLGPEDLPEFFERLAVYDGQKQTALGIELIAHTFVRTKELRFARKAEFKLDTNEPIWRIPGERMKVKRDDHIVPLTARAVALVHELMKIAGDSDWLLPGDRANRPISENTLLYALYRMGYHKRATIHGFRGLASTVLNESGKFEPDWIEKQLAHDEANQVRAAYNSAQWLPQRRAMMVWWSDYLQNQKEIGELLGR